MTQSDPPPLFRVLILCTGNAARSQMAEAILRHLSRGQIQVESAGTIPKPEIHPMARPAMQRLFGLDMARQHPKAVDRVIGEQFDYVITVCDSAAERCPVFPGVPARIHWSLDDPAAVPGTDAVKQRAFEATANAPAARIRAWVSPAEA